MYSSKGEQTFAHLLLHGRGEKDENARCHFLCWIEERERDQQMKGPFHGSHSCVRTFGAIIQSLTFRHLDNLSPTHPQPLDLSLSSIKVDSEPDTHKSHFKASIFLFFQEQSRTQKKAIMKFVL